MGQGTLRPEQLLKKLAAVVWIKVIDHARKRGSRAQDRVANELGREKGHD